MVEQSRVSVPLPQGSCDMRLGQGALDRLGADLHVVVGRPRACGLAFEQGEEPELVERCRRLLTDAGFLVSPMPFEASSLRRLDAASRAFATLAAEGLTGDDALVAVGGRDLLSLASFVAGAWCSGMVLAFVATTQEACVVSPMSPRPLDVGDLRSCVAVAGFPRVLVADPDAISASEGVRGARAAMLQTAVADSDAALDVLSAHLDQLAAGEWDAVCEQLGDTARRRGRIASSTSVAIRQSLEYGLTFARGLSRLLGPDADAARVLAEGMRFEGRLAVAVEGTAPDFAFAQDEMLDALGLAPVPASLDPDELLEACKGEAFCRSNRFLPALPLAVGRVRRTTVPDELLSEHLDAWCAAHARLDASTPNQPRRKEEPCHWTRS